MKYKMRVDKVLHHVEAQDGHDVGVSTCDTTTQQSGVVKGLSEIPDIAKVD
jgi:threonine aldolase